MPDEEQEVFWPGRKLDLDTVRDTSYCQLGDIDAIVSFGEQPCSGE